MARAQVDLGQLLVEPFDVLRRLRTEGPLADVVDSGMVAVLRYEDARAALADRRFHANFVDFLTSFGVISGPFFDWMAGSPLNRDGAEHHRWRALMNRTFTPRSVERLRPFLQQAAHGLIDAFAARGQCEFVREFSDVFPSLGLSELIGVPADDRERFTAWANTIGLGFSPLVSMHIAQVDAASVELLAYAGELAAARRTDPRDDLVTRIAAAAAEEGWTDAEVRGSIAGLVFAGHDTTKSQLGWMISVLAAHADLWDAVASQSVPAAAVVEEVLRYRSSVAGLGRTASEPAEAAGCPFAAGQRIFVSLWSANQDEGTFPHPESVDPAQSQGAPHLAFGYGPHHCLGAALARAELQEALAALTARLECPCVGADAEWRPPIGLNGPVRLPLHFKVRETR
ncbi:MAG TPA: cytochrome P450 [Polyangiaceae bacterium]|nr:cytochrome P450 [Polyangiaceae bacterium]